MTNVSAAITDIYERKPVLDSFFKLHENLHGGHWPHVCVFAKLNK